MLPWDPSGTLLDPIWHPRLKKSEHVRKISLTLRRVWPFELLLGHLGAHFEDPGAKKSVPKASKGNFVDIVKTLIFHWFL